jgi:acetyltransferase-like isoleucine patch superfamily enzyme
LPEIADGAQVSGDAQLADDVVVGHGSVIGPGTIVGEGCVIEDGAVLGKQPRLRPGSSAARTEALPPLRLGTGVIVCCGAVVYAGSTVGNRVIIGDQSQVRERVEIGDGSVVGRGSSVDFDTRVGARVSIQTGVYVTGGSVVEDDVFLGPGVQTTNDHTMGRHPRGERLQGPVFRRACRVGGGVVIVPGVEIGEEAFVAAGALVTQDVPARGVVMGVPARVVRRVTDEDLLERWR